MPKKQQLSKELADKYQIIGRAQFLSLKPEILGALEDKWSLRKIWKHLSQQGQFTCGYHYFAKLAQDYKKKSSNTSNQREKILEEPQLKNVELNLNENKARNFEFVSKTLSDDELF